MKDAFNFAPALMILVIDGLLAFEEGQEREIKDLMSLLRKSMGAQDKVLKVLITSDRRIGSINEDLEVDKKETLAAGTQGTTYMLPFLPGGDLGG